MHPFLKERVHPKNFEKAMGIAANPIIHSKLFFLRRFFLFTEKKKRQNKKNQKRY